MKMDAKNELNKIDVSKIDRGLGCDLYLRKTEVSREESF